MIINFKIFEDNFYQETFWYFELVVYDFSMINPSYTTTSDYSSLERVISYGKNIINDLNKKNINFRTYTNQVNQENVDGIIFLFKNKEDVPNFIKSQRLILSLDTYKEIWEGKEIPNNDLDLYFNAKKFGL